jgi:hypothetical protein
VSRYAQTKPLSVSRLTSAIQIRLNTEVIAITERSKRGVRVQIRPRRAQPDHHNPVGADQDTPVHEEQYDEIVLCILADTAKRLLGKTAGWMEKGVLGSTRWSDDITVTHNVCGLPCHAVGEANYRCVTGFGLHQQMVYS